MQSKHEQVFVYIIRHDSELEFHYLDFSINGDDGRYDSRKWKLKLLQSSAATSLTIMHCHTLFGIMFTNAMPHMFSHSIQLGVSSLPLCRLKHDRAEYIAFQYKLEEI